MTRWFRAYWDDEDVWFYFEVDADGWVSRQVELRGPDGIPIAAASLTEWQQAQAEGRLSQYEATYGLTAEGPVQEWDEYELIALTAAKFEEVWNRAEDRPVSRVGRNRLRAGVGPDRRGLAGAGHAHVSVGLRGRAGADPVTLLAARLGATGVAPCTRCSG